MSIIENKFTKDLSLDIYSSDLQVITAQQGDKKSRFVKISIFANGEPMQFVSGISAVLKGHRADGQIIYDKCIIDNNCIIVELTETILCVPGDCVFNIGFYGQDNSLLSTVPFKVHISKNPYDENEIIATPIFSALTDALNKVNKALEDVKKAISDSTEKINEMNTLKENITDKMTEFQTAENARVQAEIQRNQKFQETIQKTEEATNNANNAADKALNAAEKIDELTSGYENAVELFVQKKEVGNPNGVASLKEDGKIPLEQLPEIDNGGTGIYVQEEMPNEVKMNEHWFKVICSLNALDYDFVLS